MRIGILGGTFNPIHNGHLWLARLARRKLRLDKIIFVPAKIPPHKSKIKILAAKERYRMVKLAIKGFPWFNTSDYEIKTKGTSYSVKTLEYFRRRLDRKAKIFFLAGSDSLGQLNSWKDLKKIIKISDFVIVSRPGYKITEFPGIKIISIPAPDISSTNIRSRIKRGLSIKGLLPKDVVDYIYKKGFYR
jgi:nicotinate-nucleotide adenylyltransferase